MSRPPTTRRSPWTGGAVLGVRLSATEVAALRALAAARGVAVSALVRDAALALLAAPATRTEAAAGEA